MATMPLLLFLGVFIVLLAGYPVAFSLAGTGPTTYHPSLGSNPYGQGAFYDADSGVFLFDLPYAPSQIVAALGLEGRPARGLPVALVRRPPIATATPTATATG